MVILPDTVSYLLIYGDDVINNGGFPSWNSFRSLLSVDVLNVRVAWIRVKGAELVVLLGCLAVTCLIVIAYIMRLGHE